MNILDLEPGFTDKELRKNYEEQMIKWYLDICSDSRSEEMSKN